MSRPLAAACLLWLAGLACGHAAEPVFATQPAPAQATAVQDGADLIIELGVGGLVSPAYEGSDEYILSPYPIISLDYLRLPGLFEIGGGEDLGGLSFGPSFRFIDERSDDEFDELTGLDEVDATYELGLRASYEFPLSDAYATEIYAATRYAFGGADGFVGELGVDAVWRPTRTFELKVGPLVTLASGGYMDTYFSVSSPESIASGGRFDAFEAGGGFKSVGAKLETRYEFRRDLFLTASAEYQRLVSDAADSPVTDVGDRDQFFAGLGLSKRFSLDLF